MGTAGLVMFGCAASLLTLGTAALSLSRSHVHQKALNARLRHVSEHYALTGPVASETDHKRELRQGLGVLSRLARGIGYKRDEPFLYPLRWWIVCVVAVAPARLVVWLLSTVLDDAAMLALPIAWLWLCRSAFGWMEDRYSRRLLLQFPDALGMITRAVRAGIPVNVAVRAVSEEAPVETAREFQRGAEQLALGNSLEAAVTEMARQSRLPEYRFFATALSLQAQTGGGLSETLENLADVIRKRVAMSARGDALAGEAKTSAAILAALPLFTGGALLVISPAYAALLFQDSGGRKLLALSIALLTGGILTMRHIIRKSLS